MRRSRDADLRRIIPKLIGTLHERSIHRPNGHREWRIKDGIHLLLYQVRDDAFSLTVQTAIGKVLSVQLTVNVFAVDLDVFNYMDCQCAVLSWKRGTWETTILTDAATAHDLSFGVGGCCVVRDRSGCRLMGA